MTRFNLQAFLAVSAVLAISSPSYAQFIVADPANLVQNALSAVSEAGTLASNIQQLVQMIKEVEQTAEMIKTLDPSKYTDLMRLLGDSDRLLSRLQSDLGSVGYNSQNLATTFNRIFPKDGAAWRQVRVSDFDSLYSGWQSQILGSAKVAASAQLAVSKAKSNNQSALNLLAGAAGENGEVRQLQTMNQMLTGIQDQLNNLIQALAATGKLTADMAAGAASEKEMLRESKARRMSDYTYRGAPVVVGNTLP